MALLQRAVEGVPDLRSSMKDIINFYKMHPSIMIRPFQKAPEGAKSRPMRFTESSQETHDYHLCPQDDSQPTIKEGTLVETYEVHMSKLKPKDNPSRVFIPELLWKKFSSDDRKLIIEYNKKITPKTWSPSSGNTRTLPNTPSVPDGGKSRSISCHQGQEEGDHESDNLSQ